MGVVKGDVIKKQDILNQIDSLIRTKIVSQIAWHQGALPPSLPGGYASAFGPQQIALSSQQDLGSVGSASAFNSALTNLLVLWSCVRRLTYTARRRNWIGGPSVTYSGTNVASLTTNNYVNFGWSNGGDGLSTSQTPPYSVNLYSAITQGKPTKGELMVAQQVNDILDQCYQQWLTVPSISFVYQYCHGSCYWNCHGSGGTR